MKLPNNLLCLLIPGAVDLLYLSYVLGLLNGLETEMKSLKHGEFKKQFRVDMCLKTLT